jgi:predicted component of type VI protein secretion system
VDQIGNTNLSPRADAQDAGLLPPFHKQKAFPGLERKTTLMGRVAYFRETSNDESDQAAEAATLRIVERVENFEGIRRVKEA